MIEIEISAILFISIAAVFAFLYGYERSRRILAEQLATTASVMADTATELSVHMAAKDKIRQLLHTEPNQHRDAILQHFKENHPQMPWEHVERAFNEVKRELVRQ